jgi:hypothetical protein
LYYSDIKRQNSQQLENETISELQEVSNMMDSTSEEDSDIEEDSEIEEEMYDFFATKEENFFNFSEIPKKNNTKDGNCIDWNVFLHKNTDCSLIAALLATLAIVHKFGKGKKGILKSLINLMKLCLPFDNNFPKTLHEFEKVIIYFDNELSSKIIGDFNIGTYKVDFCMNCKRNFQGMNNINFLFI